MDSSMQDAADASSLSAERHGGSGKGGVGAARSGDKGAMASSKNGAVAARIGEEVGDVVGGIFRGQFWPGWGTGSSGGGGGGSGGRGGAGAAERGGRGGRKVNTVGAAAGAAESRGAAAAATSSTRPNVAIAKGRGVGRGAGGEGRFHGEAETAAAATATGGMVAGGVIVNGDRQVCVCMCVRLPFWWFLVVLCFRGKPVVARAWALCFYGFGSAELIGKFVVGWAFAVDVTSGSYCIGKCGALSRDGAGGLTTECMGLSRYEAGCTRDIFLLDPLWECGNVQGRFMLGCRREWRPSKSQPALGDGGYKKRNEGK